MGRPSAGSVPAALRAVHFGKCATRGRNRRGVAQALGSSREPETVCAMCTFSGAARLALLMVSASTPIFSTFPRPEVENRIATHGRGVDAGENHACELWWPT
jgi:hypothetical protein